MLSLILFLTLPYLAFGSQSCDELFMAREKGLEQSQSAFTCYQQNIKTQSQKQDIAHHLNRMSYLKFFIAEYLVQEKEELLLEAIEFSEKSLLLFGPKYSVPTYMKLEPIEKQLVASALYNYGLSTARYVDIKGKWEAIKRMEDIKRSMDSIIRIKEETTAFYGAHRTLGIFHMKVPFIAGGRIELSKKYFAEALENTRFSGEISLYPANNLVFSDLMYKLGQNDESCRHLILIAKLTENDVRAMENDLFLETMEVIKEAKELLVSRKCTI
jgi:tetratricopeptide (TPR) repeat protein